MTTAPRMASKGVFKRLYSEAELASMTTRERNRYELSLKNYRDMLADRETTRVRLKEAFAEGRAERDSFWINKLRKSGLTEEQIASILKDMN